MSTEKKTVSADTTAKKKFNTKKLKYGSVATAITVIIIAVVVLINVIVSLIGKRTDLTIDLTSAQAFDISQESIDYLNTLNEDVEIVTMVDEAAFQSTTSAYQQVHIHCEDLLHIPH